jgi:hypothetical protein
MPFVRPARGVVKNLRDALCPDTFPGGYGAQGWVKAQSPLGGRAAAALTRPSAVALALAVLRPELWYSSGL